MIIFDILAHSVVVVKSFLKGGENMTGAEVKKLIESSGLRCWQVAKLWGLNDGNFSRRLREPFNDDEVSRIKDIIAELKKEK